MEMIPFENMEPLDDNSYLSDRAVFARDKDIERKLSRRGKRESLTEKLQAATELIGGVSRMAIWADENPGEAYSLLARLEMATMAKRIDHTIRAIQPSIPPTALDGDPMDVPFEDVNNDGNK